MNFLVRCARQCSQQCHSCCHASTPSWKYHCDIKHQPTAFPGPTTGVILFRWICSFTFVKVNLQSTTAVVYIGGSAISAVCQPLNQYSASTGSCTCYSSCPTPQMTLDQQAAARLAAQQAALALQAILNTCLSITYLKILHF